MLPNEGPPRTHGVWAGVDGIRAPCNERLVRRRQPVAVQFVRQAVARVSGHAAWIGGRLCLAAERGKAPNLFLGLTVWRFIGYAATPRNLGKFRGKARPLLERIPIGGKGAAVVPGIFRGGLHS